jgi:hypothetical protein
MATNQEKAYYKNNKRQPRVQTTEENFNFGMNYTNTPLEQGYQKALVNYDIKNEGKALRPRAGLRVTELGMYPIIAAPIAYNDSMQLSAGRDCVSETGVNSRQLILSTPTAELRPNTNLYLGAAYALTMNMDTNKLEYLENITISPMSHETLSATGVFFNRPVAAEIHGIKLSNLTYIARQVGTFAYNNSYYYFTGPQALYHTKLVNNKYEPELVPIRDITPKEAVLWGYNMLKENPYTFTDTEAAALSLQGMLPYDANNKIIMSPQTNQTIFLRCFYAAPRTTTFKFVWEWREPGAPGWASFKTETISMADLPALKAEFSSPVNSVMIRLSAYKETETPGTFEDLATQVLAVGFSFNKESYGSTANIKLETYDLSTATGMTYWKNSLVVYGLLKDPTVVFISDVNDPGYFPYPNRVEVFDEPVVHAVPLLDKLLIFTKSQLHLLTLDTDGLSWTRQMIQGNLDIKEWDIHLIQPVKNMVFFKSGNYYYMVVPKVTSATGGLTIAPISKNIEAYLDNFLEITKEIIDLLYAYKDELTLIHYYNFLDFEDMHNIYVFNTSLGVYINVDLLYNTMSRTWRIHFYESQNILVPYKQDATKKGTLASVLDINQRWQEGEVVRTGHIPGIQFFQFTENNPKDFALAKGITIFPEIDALSAQIDSPVEQYEALHVFKNYQYLDLGYRNQSTDYNKRYREIQLKFNNISQMQLQFLTEFSIDGDLRKSFYRYETRHEIDPENPNYGILYLERVPIDADILPGSTIFGASALDENAWTLDTSLFPEAVLWKVRIPVSGKGASPKMRMLSFNEEMFEQLSTTWVFRMMNLR